MRGIIVRDDGCDRILGCTVRYEKVRATICRGGECEHLLLHDGEIEGHAPLSTVRISVVRDNLDVSSIMPPASAVRLKKRATSTPSVCAVFL